MDLPARVSQPAAPREKAPQASLSCQRCRRRKIKCDRQQPKCGGCSNSLLNCTYPLGPLKPGPKPRHMRQSRQQILEKRNGACRTDIKSSSVSNAVLDSPLQYMPSLGVCQSLDHDIIESDCASKTKRLEQSSLLSNRRLSVLIHPNHEPTSPEPGPFDPIETVFVMDPGVPFSIGEALMEEICKELKTTSRDIHGLIQLYFDNMLSFNMFTPALFEAKLQSAPAWLMITLLAAMFSFSARFRPESTPIRDAARLPTAEDFFVLSKKKIEHGLPNFQGPPPLSLLQAMVLTCFYELTGSAAGSGWRSIGSLVRVAYELRLHLLDTDNEGHYMPVNVKHWSLKEERRRVWWAIWELDVFASTTRRLPTAIDWNQNWTKLPVDDESWVRGDPQDSCHLATDSMERLQLLQACGNRSAKAWFILLNSLMRTAYCLSHPHEHFSTPTSLGASRTGGQVSSRQMQYLETLRNTRKILTNVLHCFKMALPNHLRYRGQSLFTHASLSSNGPKQLESDIYSIHAMMQLTKFMLSHRNAAGNPDGCEEGGHMSDNNYRDTTAPTTPDRQLRVTSNVPYSPSVGSADEILMLVRNSSPEHVQYVNPFLANTVWLAAAVFLVYSYFGVSLDSAQEGQLIKSNVWVLKAVYLQFLRWWGISDILVSKFDELEQELQRWVHVEKSNVEGNHPPARAGDPQMAHAQLTDMRLGSGSSDTRQPFHASDDRIAHNTRGMVTSNGMSSGLDAIEAGDASRLALDSDPMLLSQRLTSGPLDDDVQWNLELHSFVDSMLTTFRAQQDQIAGIEGLAPLEL
ncbi:hypothetical protein BO78DRAFT_371111 [Aspergillus sclerotiicarbonarius CBS 121057]|uniref:Zn(2)-C6 fungal-type domain-containing protein n=1 Tax=Aspergillus sclerotiicarbonarius (strain CBS 121057 / IBT 28362) TaxID=1448318 RepID=A0A319EUX4_ASPSB|nr:hypothetical protein BO78DRAFT_371111 [Aspergillus sclerotiicarbonarius CBS 121057]